MRANAKADTNTILIRHWQRRQDEMDRLANINDQRAKHDADFELIGMVVFFGLLFTAIALAIWLPGKHPSTPVVTQGMQQGER